jgi:hypothetical protein
MLVAEAIERPLHGRKVGLTFLCPSICRRAFVVIVIDDCVLDCPPCFDATQFGKEDISQDLHQPSAKIGARLPRVEAADCTHQTILDEVFGEARVACQHAGITAQPRDFPLQQARHFAVIDARARFPEVTFFPALK